MREREYSRWPHFAPAQIPQNPTEAILAGNFRVFSATGRGGGASNRWPHRQLEGLLYEDHPGGGVKTGVNRMGMRRPVSAAQIGALTFKFTRRRSSSRIVLALPSISLMAAPCMRYGPCRSGGIFAGGWWVYWGWCVPGYRLRLKARGSWLGMSSSASCQALT